MLNILLLFLFERIKDILKLVNSKYSILFFVVLFFVFFQNINSFCFFLHDALILNSTEFDSNGL